MASIQLRNVCKHYDNGHVAISDLDLDVRDGEFMVIVGPSGCGKSTTLRMVAGLEAITEGHIHLGDRRINDVPPGERDVAMVFQNYTLYPHLTGRDNLSFGLRTRRTPKSEIQSRVAEAADLLSIQSLLDRRPEQMSGGEKQRIALGRAIVRKPVAFLFDEPLSNLDAQLRVQMRIQLAQLHQRMNTTTLYVTHDQSEAMTLADRLAVLKNGVLQQVGTPLDVYDRPANRFVAGFIGSPGMNLVDGQITNEAFLTDSISYPIPNTSLPSGPCTLGFRPEDVTIDSAGPRFADATITVVERFGHDTIVHCQPRGGDETIAVRVPRKVRLSVGDGAPLHLASDRAHFFSVEDGRRII